jgi:hypothetical protein
MEFADPELPFTGMLGEGSTGVMSNADLEANRQGGKFYADIAKADADKAEYKSNICKYINDNYSEEINKNRYTPKVEAKIPKARR